MNLESQKNEIRERAKTILESGVVQNPFVQKKGLISEPIHIYNQQKEIKAWFVGLIIEDKLVGYIQFDSNLIFLRYTTFQRRPDSLDNCPDVKKWLDIETIKDVVKTKVNADEEIFQPYLSFNKNISRIAWAVETVNQKGEKRLFFVTGDYVFIDKDYLKT